MNFKRVILFAAMFMLLAATSYAQVPELKGQVDILQMTTDLDHTALGTADLSDNSAIIGQVQVTSGTGWAVGTAEDMRIWLQQGFNSYAWDGMGIQSQTAAAEAGVTALTGINWAYGQTYLDWTGQTTFHDVAVSPGDILLSYGYYGDCNFDGLVLYDDYGFLDYAYGTAVGGATLAQYNAANGSTYEALGSILGDIGYSGQATYDNYGFIDYGYGSGNPYGALNPAYVLPLTGGEIKPIPEPSVVIMLIMGVLAVSGLKLRSNFYN